MDTTTDNINTVVVASTPLPRLLNNAKVKQYLLERAGATRAKKFSRVSKDTLLQIEAKLKLILNNHIASLPSKGKTI